ncbi:hypothetical protein EON67_11510, partial [archaeon]
MRASVDVCVCVCACVLVHPNLAPMRINTRACVAHSSLLCAAALLVKGEGKVASGLRVDKVSVDTNKDVAADFSLTEAFGSKRTKLTFK